MQERLDYWFDTSEPPTAILTYDASSALYLMHALYLRKWFVPDRVSVMSCDDEILLHRAIQPVTAVDLNRTLMGVEAARMLLEKMSIPGRQLPTQFIQGTVIERLSVATI